MIQSTKEYGKFKLRADNREIIPSLVERLISSISAKNMLEFRPIIVNSKMEVIDGQHRLEAAKQLQIPIFYEVIKDIKTEDMIALNISKSWLMRDYFNFWKKQGNKEYLKLQEFIDENKISFKVAISLLCGRGKDVNDKFKNGEFVFGENKYEDELKICNQTVEVIGRLNGYLSHTTSTKFWRSLVFLVRSPNFNAEKWFCNLERLSNRIAPKVTEREYLKMFIEIHNWKNHTPIDMSRIGEFSE